MPRKAFVADLQDAISHFEKANVSDLKAGEEDGMITFDYHLSNGDTTAITILIPDLGDYPDSHMYMIYTNSQHVPKAIHGALDGIDSFSGVKVPQMLSQFVKHLNKATSGSQNNPVDLDDEDDEDAMVVDSDTHSESADGFDGDTASDDDDDDWSHEQTQREVKLISTSRHGGQDVTTTLAINDRIRNDLRLAKEAGFRISCLGTLIGGGRDGFVSLSVHVSKLGISEETLQAWHMDRSQYFVLLIRYTDGYVPLERILNSELTRTSHSVQLRAGLHQKYKMTIQESLNAFVQLEHRFKKTAQSDVSPKAPDKGSGLERLFIGRPLEELLNTRLFSLIRYRKGHDLGWRGAEEFFNDHQGRNVTTNDTDPKYWKEDAADCAFKLPNIVIADHLATYVTDKSFPLIAMQFALRHLVRCTEFCLVCHCKIDVDFEALKPYVCSKPLCLYQYMSLGFGPSIEHEIITQPHVVDLLISFCYSSAHARSLRYLPTGMALMVPGSEGPMDHLISASTAKSFILDRSGLGNNKPLPQIENLAAYHRAKFDPIARDIIFPSGYKPPLQIGTWISYGPVGHGRSQESYHARVVEVLLPTVKLSQPIGSPRNAMASLHIASSIMKSSHTDPKGLSMLIASINTPPTSSTNLSTLYQEIEFAIYNQNFDELNDFEKQSTICSLLDTLPSVQEMKTFLLSRGGQHTPLHTWNDRISPASIGILRWIIASNRSCILQVDSLDGSDSNQMDRVSGMPGWMQFRFAQGAPDKEQRFITSIRENTSEAQFPTIFAWHGSPLQNWHGIVREGLHFEQTAHGRAFGNGVYHSLMVHTSLSYSGFLSHHIHRENEDNTARSNQWPNSQLRISKAIVLNEIVNAPHRFVSKSPHLVISELDWIQSRYLFVMCNLKNNHSITETPVSQVYAQDPAYVPTGQDNKRISIPVTAVSRSRRPVSPSSLKSKNKKQRIGDDPPSYDEISDAVYSDDTDVEDNMIFFPTEEEEQLRNPKAANAKHDKGKALANPTLTIDQSKSDFVPGTLEVDKLPLIDPPSYATSSATRTLQRELTGTLKIQDTHPLHELGWYIDRELITNVYQWILELHSFESHLPIAQDLKSKGLKSVVLEIRFGKDYPMSPPFVRVIRPRFLSFMEGGGGHVTAGGALCMELLTNSGWSAVSNIESVLLQVRLAMSSTDPRPARLAKGAVRDYGVGEAVDAYVRACTMHGWEIPPDFRASYGPSALR